MKAIYYGSEIWHNSDYDKNKYGLPELKKYPMPDREHVKSAIRFFNYVDPQHEKELADAIIRRIKEYHMTDISVGPDNRFGKYYQGDKLVHRAYFGVDPYNPDSTAEQHGIIGMKWGVWNEETRARYLGGSRRGSGSTSISSNTKGSKGSNKLNYRKKTGEYESTIKEIQDDAQKVNGGRMAALFAQDRSNNCAYCTAAYELRRRGYDVKSAEAIYGVDLVSHPDLMFKGAKANLLIDNTSYKKDKEGNYITDKSGNKKLSMSAYLLPKGITKQQFKNIESELVKQGEGARGNIFGFFAGSAYAGHSMAYEIVNGKLCIIDSQVGSVHDGSSILKDPYQDLSNFRELYYTRTDNLKVNDKLINNFVIDSSIPNKTDSVKVAKTVLATASWFVPGAGLAYYGVSIADNVANKDKRKAAYERIVKEGY